MITPPATAPIKALIIDDEAPARDDLHRLLGRHPEVTIVGESANVTDAQVLLAMADYDLVFLDVQLRGGTGFDLVPHVRAGRRIIFVTGYEKFALRAFEVNALDYLLKPVEPARLAASLARLNPSAAPAPVQEATPTLTFDDAVFVKTDAGTARFVRLREVAAIFSNENYTEVHLTPAGRHLIRRTLKTWEEQLPATDFMRVHRTAIVNLRTVQRATHLDREVTHLFLEGLVQHPVRARRELWPEIERRLGALGHRVV